MGLDMSLYREVHLENKMEITDKKLNEVLDGGKPLVKHEVCYWRKFNALHKYFYDNFGDGDNDNCVNMYMNIEDISELLIKIKKIREQVRLKDGVIENPEVCLPTEEGFFFGSTEYDEYYVYNLDETIKQLDKVIDDHDKLIKAGVDSFDINYYYRAWY